MIDYGISQVKLIKIKIPNLRLSRRSYMGYPNTTDAHPSSASLHELVNTQVDENTNLYSVYSIM